MWTCLPALFFILTNTSSNEALEGKPARFQLTWSEQIPQVVFRWGMETGSDREETGQGKFDASREEREKGGRTVAVDELPVELGEVRVDVVGENADNFFEVRPDPGGHVELGKKANRQGQDATRGSNERDVLTCC